MAETDDVRLLHPEVVRRAEHGGVWPVEAPFPLMPLETWFVAQGWVSIDQVRAMSGKIEGSND